MAGLGLIAAVLLAAPPDDAQGVEACPVEFQVVEGGSRRPLAGIDVTTGERVIATSDGDGRVSATLDCGARVSIHEGGYRDWTATSAEIGPRVFLMPVSSRYRTEVVDTREPEEASVGTEVLDVEVLRTLPGAQGDPLRALQSSPSHGRTPGGAGLLVLHGLAPPAVQAFVAGHPVPRAFHSFGLAGVVAAEQITAIEVYPSGYSARYGGATGGLVVVDTSNRIPERVGGDASLSLTGVQAGVEAPVGRRTGLEVRGRVGIFGPPLAVADAIAPGSGLVRPEAYSYWTRLTHRRGRSLYEGRVFGALDRVRLGDTVDLFAGFHRFDFEFRHRGRDWELLVSPSLRVDHSSFDQTSVARSTLSQVGSLRAEMSTGEDEGDASWRLTLGTSTVAEHVRLDSDYATIADERESGEVYRSSVYVSPTFRVGRLTLVPELRATGLGTRTRRFFMPEPRLRLRWEPTEGLWLGARVGRYGQLSRFRSAFDAGFIPNTVVFEGRQVVIPQTLAGFFDPQIAVSSDDSRVALQRATQASAEVGYRRAGVEASVAPFARVSHTLFPDSALGSVPSREQASFGAEFRLGYEGERLSLLAGYTLLRSLRRRGRGRWSPAAFDQPHALVLLGQVRFARGWMLGARFRLTSGLPYAPVVGAIQSAPDTFAPLFDSTRSARSPPFHQLDLRVDKRWVLKRSTVTAFLDVVNVYSHVYPELRTYRLDFSERGRGLGLPILPTLGVSIEY